MAEWLGSGLQHHLRRFESVRDLNKLETLLFGSVFFYSKSFGEALDETRRIDIKKRFTLVKGF